MNRTGVMHLIDSLAAGGSERVAVNLSNNLPRTRYQVHLCASRRGGPLLPLVRPDVKLLMLARQGRFDPAAVLRLTLYIRRHDIKLLHAHSSSIFLAAVASLLPPHPKVVWHDHFGRFSLETRPAALYRLAAMRISGVIGVSAQLADWSRSHLSLDPNRVWQIPNFVEECDPSGDAKDLPGEVGKRIVCVANLRPQKDHRTLVQAMALVTKEAPDAHLLLVGVTGDRVYSSELLSEIEKLGLAGNVTLLGHRSDVCDVLKACDIGVISSSAEAFPLALLEYGMAGLAAVSTTVGECPDVLDQGRAGLLVPPRSPQKLAEALVLLLQSPEQRKTFGEEFQKRTQGRYGVQPVIRQVCDVYDTVLGVDRQQARSHAAVRT